LLQSLEKMQRDCQRLTPQRKKRQSQRQKKIQPPKELMHPKFQVPQRKAKNSVLAYSYIENGVTLVDFTVAAPAR
jgi:hypothetical protein